MRAFNQRQLSSKNDDSELYQRDIWKAEEYGFKPDTVRQSSSQ